MYTYTCIHTSYAIHTCRNILVFKLTTEMALNLFLLASLVLACLPLSWSYRNGARSESCYDMLVMHERNVFGTITVVLPVDCGDSCQYQLSMVGRVAGEDNLTVEESNPTTYQCGEVYYCK